MIPYTIVIPARYDSQRFPGKVMALLAGRPMIDHVYQRATESMAQAVTIATDDHRVFSHCHAQGMDVVLTSRCHRSGSDRIAELAHKRHWDDQAIVVNLQGDEPLAPPQILDQVASNLHARREAQMATLCEAVQSVEELFDPNVVKVVFDQLGYACYFSRAPVPWSREDFSMQEKVLPKQPVHFRHVGLYAYRAGFLRKLASTQPCDMEMVESLEQLRALYQGAKIHVEVAVQHSPPGVDTPDDLKRTELLVTN